MKLFLLRHGQAGDRMKWIHAGKDDALRPLTKQGAREIQKLTKRLKKTLSKSKKVYTSPYRRTRQTADIVSEQLNLKKLNEVSYLKYTVSPRATYKWLKSIKKDETVILVGHDPHLSQLICYLLTGKTRSFMELKKGGIAQLEANGEVAPGKFRLINLIEPKTLLVK